MSIWLIIFFGYPNKRLRHGQTPQHTTPGPSRKLPPDEKVLYYLHRPDKPVSEYPESYATCTKTKDGISCGSRHKSVESLAAHQKTIGNDHQDLNLALMKFPPGGKNEITGLYECGIGDCNKDFQSKQGMRDHQDKFPHDNML